MFLACGWTLAGIALALIPLWAIHGILTRKANTFWGVSEQIDMIMIMMLLLHE